MMRITPMIRPTNMPLSVRKVPSDCGHDVLGREHAPEGEGRDHDGEAADSMSIPPMTL